MALKSLETFLSLKTVPIAPLTFALSSNWNAPNIGMNGIGMAVRFEIQAAASYNVSYNVMPCSMLVAFGVCLPFYEIGIANASGCWLQRGLIESHILTVD